MNVHLPDAHHVLSAALVCAMCAALLTAVAVASSAPEADKSAPEKKTQESSRADKAPSNALPDLDELLNLPRSGKKKQDQKPSINPDQLELNRALNAQTVSEMFQQAVLQMSDAADLLRKAHNTGLATQRVQEEIIRKLDKLIEEAERQQSSSSSSSSSQQQQHKQKSKQPAQPQQARNKGNQGENRGERTPPAGQEARLKGKIDSLGAAWGSLPARLRDALLQGAGDTYSSLYESLTEAYYRKLAEQHKDQQ